MPVNESQLITWASAPSSTKIQHTYDLVKKAIENSQALKTKSYKVYLQGSYANHTNIKVDSDVDIVVQLNSTFNHDLSRLSSNEKQLFHQAYPNSATYRWSDFRRDVVKGLEDFFGAASVDSTANKSLKIAGAESRIDADVVPCLEHRNYSSFAPLNRLDYVPGIKFWTMKDNKEIINYPKPHIENGQDKNAQHRTDEMYKNIVRVLKQIKHQLVLNHGLNPKIAPSYFIESAVYNAPDSHFTDRHDVSLGQTLDFLLRKCDTDSLVTVSHQHNLFGTEPWQWNVLDAGTFFQAVESF